jgi:hypothetical protein
MTPFDSILQWHDKLPAIFTINPNHLFVDITATELKTAIEALLLGIIRMPNHFKWRIREINGSHIKNIL